METPNRCYDYCVFSLQGEEEKAVGWGLGSGLVWTGGLELPVLGVKVVDVDSGKTSVDSDKGVASNRGAASGSF